jgi:hypothetical protein
LVLPEEVRKLIIASMKSRVPLLMLAIFLAAAPLSARESKHIHETVDPYSGVKMLSLEIGTHGCLDDRPLNRFDAQVELIVYALQMQPHQVEYLIAPQLESRHLKLPYAKGATLDVSIDGAAMRLGPAYPKTKRVERSAWSGRHVNETVPFDVTPETLKKLSQATEIHFRVNARYDSVQRCVDAHDLRDLREFLGAAAAY